MKVLVVCGNPLIGYHFTGPFDNAEDANAWADEYLTREYDWWIAPVATPEGESK